LTDSAQQLSQLLDYDLGLDSIDLVNVANGIAERIGLEIPEVDRASLTNVEAILDYVLEHPVAEG